MSAHDEIYIKEFQPKLPQSGDIVNISWEWNDKFAAIYALKHLIKKISEGHLPDKLEAGSYSGLPCVRIDVTPKQNPMAYLDEEDRLELIERN